MKYDSNMERGIVIGAFLPNCVKKNQDFQKNDNSKRYKSKMKEFNFSKEFNTKKVGKFEKKSKSSSQINEKEYRNEQIVPKLELDRQEYFYNISVKNIKNLEKQIKIINFAFVEKDIEETKSKYIKPKVGSFDAKTFHNNDNEWYKPNLNPVEISDCGFTASWVYECVPWKNFEKCVENITDGAWVPYPVMYGYKYEQCKNIQESDKRQFNEDYNEDYK